MGGMKSCQCLSRNVRNLHSVQWRRPLSSSARRRNDDPTAEIDLMNALSTPRTALSSFYKTERRSETADPTSTSKSNIHAAETPPTPLATRIKLARKILTKAEKRAKDSTIADIEKAQLRRDLEQQWPRRWMTGDVYAPRDVSAAEMGRWKRTVQRPSVDAFSALAIDPVKEYKNFSIMSEYMTETGRIKHSRETGLRPANQRKIAKAIRRAIGLGLMPSVYRHPELMEIRSRSRY